MIASHYICCILNWRAELQVPKYAIIQRAQFGALIIHYFQNPFAYFLIFKQSIASKFLFLFVNQFNENYPF
jgi:hypothetical protein